MTTTSHDNTNSQTNLVELLDQFPEDCDPDFDNAYDELEREFAELRLTFSNY